MDVINYIVNLGTSVMMPIIFFVVAIAFGVKIAQAAKAALLIGIGFEGLDLVINLLLDNLGPAVTAMTNRVGVDLNVLDTGWPVAATVGWGSQLMLAGVILFIVINVGMIVLKLTDTVDIDIFNYWIFLCIGAMVYEVSGSIVIAMIAMAIIFVLSLKAADLTAEKIGKEFQFDGISFPHFMAFPWIIFGIAVDFVFEKIPVLKKMELSPDKMNKKFGVLGEPTVIGFVLGAVIGALAGYEAGKLLSLAIKVAAAMVLLPRMVDILMEGLNIVKDAVQKKMKKIFPGRKFYIGMDVALLIGNPSIIAVGLLLIPITIVLAILLPWNKTLPFVDLPSLIFIVTLMAAYCRKDMLRMLVAGTLMMCFILFAATNLSPVYSQAAHAANAAFPKGIDTITCLNVAFTNPLGWLIVKIGQLF